MRINFTKMHGLGNDFVVIDAFTQPVSLNPDQIRVIADRHFGIGCDQVLMVHPPQSPDVDFRYRIYNSDGGEVEQCGNGARCFARFVTNKGLAGQSEINVETLSGVIKLHLTADGQVSVGMGVPQFDPEYIPFIADAAQLRYALKTTDGEHLFGVVSIGNPHAVMQVDNIADAPVETVGPSVEGSPRFPRRTNVGFVQIIDRTHVHLRVYERGVGETLACGSGACAAVVLGRQWGLLDDKVEVQLTGGRLNVDWPGGQEPVTMTGPAETVFEGTIEI